MTIGDFRKIDTKDIAILTILSYVIGFVITNIYLSNFAFAEFSFFHIKFIPVGFLFLSLSLIVHFGFKYIDVSYKEKAWYIRIPMFLAMTSGLIFFLSLIFANRIDSISGYNESSFFRLDFGLWVSINLILFFIISAILKTKDILIKSFKDIEKGYNFFNQIFFLLALTIFNVALFANLIYPSVPTYLGGGRQIQAAIVIDGEEIANPVFVRIIYQTPEYLLYESLASSTDQLKTTMIPVNRINSIEYLGIDPGTGHHIFSKYLMLVSRFIEQDSKTP